MASKDILFHAYSCAIIAGSVIGANAGASTVMEQNPKFTNCDFITGAVSGAGLGAVVGIWSPVIVGGAIFGLPSYILKKMQSNE